MAVGRDGVLSAQTAKLMQNGGFLVSDLRVRASGVSLPLHCMFLGFMDQEKSRGIALKLDE